MSDHANDANPYWYAVYTNPQQEDRAESNLWAWRVETFNPKLREHRYNQYSGKPIRVTKPLFPRYIFAKFKARDLLHKVWFTRGVHSVVGCGNTPSPVDDQIIDLIQSRLDKDGLVVMSEDFKSGDRVTIKTGPLKDLVGIFEHRTNSANRVRILLDSVTYQGHFVIERDLLRKVS